ncbi:hypothetical protein GmHk_04G009618 [Glycine max]|nr:hypothetical protein GmHk_04G009618 [Glycine max]
MMNVEKINKAKELSESLVNLQELEESMLRQRAKIDWLRLSDGNNKYFHVAIKIRNQTNGIKKIMRNDGTYTTDQKAIETKVVAFYRNLMGKASGDLEGVDISAIINMGKLYRKLQYCGQRMEWNNLLYGNTARPRANFILWLACHGRLSTKDRLCKYGMIDDKSCCFCSEEESMNHLFFACDNSKRVWMKVLQWVQIRHDPSDWPNELHWLIRHTKGKGTRATVLKMAIAETIYEI